MKNLWRILLLGLVVFLASACGGSPNSGITPAPDKLTLLFFYIDG